jgi:hypothetical protein
LLFLLHELLILLRELLGSDLDLRVYTGMGVVEVLLLQHEGIDVLKLLL